ncbi:hypothetical protein KUH03_26000 [Sphingobacterium sp. E70]|nr:YceI family protein [Sphingobacterium sp. E70]ULT22753.1 hypothetical protein KUH03_26000 [Sphingobacterium sp. E70]
MNRFFQFLAVAALMVNVAVAQVKWSADPGHTNARFDVKHLGISFVDGQFTKVEEQWKLQPLQVSTMQK